MGKRQHRLGVCEVNLVARHLKLEQPDEKRLASAIARINDLFGLDCVSFDAPSNVLNLAYDATRVSIEDVESILEEFEIEIGHGWWTHLKERYYRATDENVKENAQAEPWSCHKDIPRQ